MFSGEKKSLLFFALEFSMRSQKMSDFHPKITWVYTWFHVSLILSFRSSLLGFFLELSWLGNFGNLRMMKWRDRERWGEKGGERMKEKEWRIQGRKQWKERKEHLNPGSFLFDSGSIFLSSLSFSLFSLHFFFPLSIFFSPFSCFSLPPFFTRDSHLKVIRCTIKEKVNNFYPPL